jgi:ABC-type xylose transport system permease subunit
MSRATTLTSVAQQLSLSLGISIGAMTLEASTRLSGGVITADTFWPAFVVVGVLSALSGLVFARLPVHAGSEMSGHRREPAPDPVTIMRERG